MNHDKSNNPKVDHATFQNTPMYISKLAINCLLFRPAGFLSEIHIITVTVNFNIERKDNVVNI